GGGSNLVVSDAGFPGTVVHVASEGIDLRAGANGTVRVRASAGVEWDALVARCVAEGLSGVECLSGIPGRVGSTPIQNVGAYGQDVSETVVEVLVHDRAAGAMRVLGNADCAFSYRDSAFKGTDRYVVCEVVFELTRSDLSRPVRYAELARTLGVEPGGRVPLADARAAVLRLRRGKGMVLDPADPDTRSAGSFFTNPLLDPDAFTELRKRVAERLGPDVEPPGYPEPDGRVKTSAAWLIDRAGFAKGHGTGPARISSKHTLALTNPGGASTADLLALAREVRAGVAEAFGVTLVNEPVMVGVALDG
ncbi:UDP-N-acetylmuramate dehydrogenase, partial [Marinitenerispora sediminis]